MTETAKEKVTVDDASTAKLRHLAMAICQTAIDLLSDDRRFHTEDAVELLKSVGMVTGIAARMQKLKTMPYRDYLETPEWKSLAFERKMIDRYYCHRCNKREGEPGVVLHTHHKTYERRGNELIDDLETLCADCHAAEHGIDPLSREREERDEIDKYIGARTTNE